MLKLFKNKLKETFDKFNLVDILLITVVTYTIIIFVLMLKVLTTSIGLTILIGCIAYFVYKKYRKGV